MFTHLHVHSSFSPAWGVRSPEEICAAARKLGMRRLALTDRNGLYGIPHFLEVARESGIDPIIGAETVAEGHRAVLLAADGEGYENLCRLLSELHGRRDFDLPRALLEYQRGLVVMSDDPAVLAPLRHPAAGRLFVELSPGHPMHGPLALARELKIPPVATARAVLLEDEDLELHRVIRAIHLNAKLSRLTAGETASERDRLFPPERLGDFFPHCPEALENAGRIAALCKTDWDFSALVFPTFEGKGEEEAFALLEKKARSGALRRYGAIDERVEARLRKELDLIRRKGFAHYFLVVEEIAGQSTLTCGRGSAAASLVAYCLGITHVDPVRHNLFFERFLNEGRSDPPDIDIDFAWDERDAVLDFAFRRYGERRAAMVCNHVGFKGRAALREVAKVFGVPAGEITTMTERISGFWKADQTAGAVAAHPLFRGEELSADWKEILRLARRLNGQLRHLSLHCGGLIVVPDEIRRHVPVEFTAKGLPAIQWEKDQAEGAGLVKIDILGNRSLAVVRDALGGVERNTGRKIEYSTWKPLEDPATLELFRRGRTMGCFYVESPSIRLVLRKMWGENPAAAALEADLFEALVQASSLIRPAANALVQEFVARMRGKPWVALHPLLGEVLNETYGIAIYQEQITQVAMALSGFSAYEGDQLRKIVSKKHKEKKLADFRRRFFEGGEERGVPREVLEESWTQILSFAGYSFCKPHSASYALLSAKAAYLKANHPAEFMAAVVSNQGGYYTPFAYLSECRRMGLKILPPDVNESRWHYTGKGKELRVGLMQLQGLSRKGADALLAERERGGGYRGFGDFLCRTALDPSDVRLLVKAGCFDALEGKGRRPALLWELLRRDTAAAGGTGLLFEEPARAIPDPPPYDDRTVLNQEIETLGMLVSCHPLHLHRRELERLRPVPAADLLRWAGRFVTVIGWWVTTKAVEDKHGRPMEFVSFEDTSGLFDATFFPDAYVRFCRKLSRQRPYVLKGKVEEEFGVATLTVEWVGFLDALPDSSGKGVARQWRQRE